jgi:Carbamoyl-phosphate synthase L chain, ATP binding domain
MVGFSSLDEAIKKAEDIGYPVVIKAAAGGGGRGIQTANSEAEVKSASPLSQAEASAAFGDGGLCTWRNSSGARDISKCRSLAMALMSSTCSRETARCSAAVRKSGKKLRQPASHPLSAQPSVSRQVCSLAQVQRCWHS